MRPFSQKIALIGVMLSAFTLQALADESLSSARLDQAVEDLKILSADSMQGRKTGTEGSAKARAYLLERMKNIGLKPYGAKLEHSFTFQARTKTGDGPMVDGVNLLGRIAGRSSEHVMVISAHYDHIGVREGEIYNGADDNASGTAAVLAIADAMMKTQPEYDVIIALFDAEEMGLQGAKAFVATLGASGLDVSFNMNMDMVAQNDKNELYVVGTTQRPELKPFVIQLDARTPVTLKMGYDTGTGRDNWINLSDQGAFNDVGIPYLYFGVEDHQYYHKPTDTFERIPEGFYRDVVETLVTSAYELNRALPGIK